MCSGTHFTLFVTEDGRLFGSGHLFFEAIKFNSQTAGIFVELPLEYQSLHVNRVWCSRAKLNFIGIIEVKNKQTEEVYLMSIGLNFDGLLGLGFESEERRDPKV